MDATTIALILVQAMKTGTSIAEIFREAQATGEVPQEQWDEIARDIAAANDAWGKR